MFRKQDIVVMVADYINLVLVFTMRDATVISWQCRDGEQLNELSFGVLDSVDPLRWTISVDDEENPMVFTYIRA